ncbi:MAG: TIGR04211 family SH3 domain-containing protein [Deltaproteobacteria bacterium]|nr:TIGR04211 family SH3 domain-containing protein [Deltaproteobacteria bacterium]MBW1929033.1 TIGR04211 family SH3 domain-containing protein [Deltaproteobacteria bacterium]MBW2024566.1 TIGR04211 family SH3 domain-containing protein [Deltaproteobacteria bacterium]
MKKILPLMTALLWVMGFFGPCFAATVYVTDSFKITLRTGPSTENRIVSLLSSGQALEVIETEGEWSHVRVMGRGDPAPEGWVLTRYLIERLPWKKQAESLQSENKRLREKLELIQRQLSEARQNEAGLSTELRDTKKALSDLAKRYNSLREGASEYLKLKQKYSEVSEELERNQSTIEELRRENNQFRYSEKKKWFALGASVLLCGLLIGIIIGRQQKKRRSYIY